MKYFGGPRGLLSCDGGARLDFVPPLILGDGKRMKREIYMWR